MPPIPAEFDLVREVFVPEMRDLIDVASTALLTLEADASDRDAINDLFRVVHTIKGTAGMCNLTVLVEMVHSAEDLLGEVRAGRMALSGVIVDDMLACFDQISAWTDALQMTGVLPPDADGIARTRAARYRGWLAAPETVDRGDAAVIAGPPAWFDDDLRATCADYTPKSGGGKVHLLHYSPPSDAFFTGEDPMARLRAVPGRLWHRALPRKPWDRSERFDPYDCNLDFDLITDAPVEPLEEVLRPIRAYAALHPLQAEGIGPELHPATPAPAAVEEEIDGFEFLTDPVSFAAEAAEAGRDVSFAPTATTPATQAPTAEPTAAPLVQPPANAAPSEHRSAQDRALKIDPAKIDALVNLLGELVVAKNGLPFLAQRADHVFNVRELSREIRDNYGTINRIAQDLQAAVMSIRMLPVSEMFKRFPRLVRDVSRKLDKAVELRMEGESTEADKSVIEALADPLVHILRNSLDHGIEAPADRRAAGKSETATILIRAAQEGDRVVIEIRDDGRGIDPDRMRRSALSKGLITEARAAEMSDEEAVDLVFLPGFSTAAEVSDLSGRGVGMDAVRHAVQSLGGTVSIGSTVGIGTSVTLSLPLTMAVTRVMSVELDGQLYGIPLDEVEQTLRISSGNIRRIKSTEAFVLRDAVIPLLRLRSLLDLPACPRDEEAVLIIRHGGATVGLVVDAFQSGMEVILKPMAPLLQGTPGYAGTAVLGDGKVLLVLDTRELIQ